MARVPLSDETIYEDEDVIEDEGSPGKEDQYQELDFNKDPQTEYVPEEADWPKRTDDNYFDDYNDPDLGPWEDEDE